MNIFTKSYELPLSRNYVRHWGMVEGVRELIQNALDSNSPFEYVFGEDWLEIRSRNSRLTTSTLLLGSTTKEGTDAIGSFGEGYKIALLVLTREGYPVKIHNYDRLWTPSFVYSRQFEHEVLCIKDESAKSVVEGLTFRVEGLTPDNIAAIRESCLKMQREIGEVIEVSQGRILLDRPGKLYVGSLFVCETGLEYGYDVLPKHLRLERDRQTVSNFDLQWLAKEMWFESQRWDTVSHLIEADCPDLKYAEHGTPALVKEACYKAFRQKHPGAIVAKSQEELDKMVQQGMQEVIYVEPSHYSNIITTHTHYAHVAAKLATPTEQLQAFFSANRGNMQRKAIVEFKALIDASKDWRLK